MNVARRKRHESATASLLPHYCNAPIMTAAKGLHDKQHRGGSRNNLQYANPYAVIQPVTHPSLTVLCNKRHF